MPEPSEAVVLAALAAVVQDHGWRVIESPARLRASLSDLLGARVDDHQAAIDALVVSAEEGVPQDVRAVGRPGLASVRPALEHRLREWGLSDARVAWVLQSWVELLPVSTAPQPVPPPAPQPAPHPAPGVTAPPPAAAASTTPVAAGDAAPGLSAASESAGSTAEPAGTAGAAGHGVGVTLAPPTALPAGTASERAGAPTALPPRPAAGSPPGSAPGSGPEPGPPRGRRRLVIVSAAALLLVGAVVAGAVSMTGTGPEEPRPAGGTASTELSATTEPPAPEAEAAEIGVAPDGVSVAPAAGRFVMAGRSGGVRLAGLAEVDGLSRSGTVRSAPDGGRLVGFRLDDAGCGVPPCTPWSELGLKVAVGSDVRRLPEGSGPFVVAVPAGVEDVDLMMRGDGLTQTLSLLDGTPGRDNIEVLARQGRAVRVGERFTVTERTSTPLAYSETTTSTVPRAVVVERAELKFFANGLRPSAADRAFLALRMSFTIPYSVPGGTAAGTPQAFRLEEVRFVTPDGRSRPAVDLDQGPGVAIGFEVPADLRRGVLEIGGSYGLTAGDGVTPFTLTVADRSVPIRFR